MVSQRCEAKKVPQLRICEIRELNIREQLSSQGTRECRVNVIGEGKFSSVHFSLSKADLTYWSSATRSWVEDDSWFDVWVGDDSNASLHGNFSAAS
jgi:hypothetical protein